jgi:hypothetical protein
VHIDTSFCCDDMSLQVEYRCPDHADPQDCPDNLVIRWKDDSFGLPIHDGGSSSVDIRFCPWCGSPLSGRA